MNWSNGIRRDLNERKIWIFVIKLFIIVVFFLSVWTVKSYGPEKYRSIDIHFSKTVFMGTVRIGWKSYEDVPTNIVL